MDSFLVVVVAAALAMLGFVAWRLYDGDVRDAPGGWRDLPRARRRAIRRAVLRGETVLGTPAELLLAGGVATALRRRLDPARLGLAVLGSGLCAAYWAVAGFEDRSEGLVLAAAWVGVGVAGVRQYRRLKTRLDRAYVANYDALDATSVRR